tara:strand:- start:17590 stop:18765 length:1176 start_codon:yes stop_codon:yes gene_type:complete
MTNFDSTYSNLTTSYLSILVLFISFLTLNLLTDIFTTFHQAVATKCVASYNDIYGQYLFETLHVPAKSKDAITRILTMLKHIPVQHKYILTTDLYDKIKDEFPVSKRTVERDLMKLTDVFDLTFGESPEGNKWSFALDSAHHFIPSISIEEALSLKLVEEHLKQYLPSQTFEKLNSLFKKSHQVLAKDGALNKLPNLVLSVPQALKIVPSNVNQSFIDKIFEALLSSNMLLIKYHENPKSYLIKPLGILVRDYKLVLVCQYDGFNNIRNLLVHRLKAVEPSTHTFVHNFNLQAYVDKNSAAVSLNGDDICLSMEVKGYVKDLLNESVLSHKQYITPIDSTWSHVDVKLPHTLELENWLQSQLHNIKIISPKNLKYRVLEKVKSSLANNEVP